MVHDEAGHELIERHMLEQLREVAEYPCRADQWSTAGW